MVKGDRENGSVEKAEDLDQEGSRIDDHDVSLIFIHIIQDGLGELGKIKSSISSLRHIEGGHEETLNETQNGKEDDVKVQIAFGDKSTTERQNDQNLKRKGDQPQSESTNTKARPKQEERTKQTRSKAFFYCCQL